MISTALIENAGAQAERVQRTEWITWLPVLVIMPHNRCNCRCLMCDIWKIKEVRELTAEDVEPHLESLRRLGTKWVVFSGGEPLLHSHLRTLSLLFKDNGIRVTLLTAGLPLKRRAEIIADSFDDVMVSLDGPAEVHDRIRAIRGAFQMLKDGIAAVRSHRAEIPVRARCTVQKENCGRLRETVRTARSLGLNSISFLAADVSSAAFNRAEGWPEWRYAAVAPGASDVERLAGEIEALIHEHEADLLEGFIAETPSKLRRIVLHFRAQLGQCSPVSPRCNAPWVSAVIGAEGALLPCFFHPSIGNLGDGPLLDVINSERARSFRRHLDIPANPVCQRCVCPLFLDQAQPAGE